MLLLMVILATLRPFSVAASKGRWNQLNNPFKNSATSGRGGRDSLSENNDDLSFGLSEEELERDIRLLERQQVTDTRLFEV